MESLTITITGEALEQLHDIQGIISVEDTTDVVIRALRVYTWLVRKKQEGYQINLRKQKLTVARSLELHL
ncbi:MAG: hypothetical protein ACYC2T_12925 [Bacillota bacterium]